MHLASIVEQVNVQVHQKLKTDSMAVYLVDRDREEIYWVPTQREQAAVTQLADEDSDDDMPPPVPSELRVPLTTGVVGACITSNKLIRSR
jgi:hypothetical protein